MRQKMMLFCCFIFALPAAALLAQDENWETIPVPGAVCARGAPYSFFHREGASDDLLIFFEGGGACWDGATCQFGTEYSAGGPLFKDTIYFDSDAAYEGIFDWDNPENPLADHNIVYVAYCTADVHSGSSETVYQVPESSLARRSYPVRVNHNGALNARAALDWAYEHYPAPNSIALMGCSAGAYGAIIHSYNIMDHYSGISFTHLSDSGVGVLPEGWQGFRSWNALDNIHAEVVEAGQIDYENLDVNQLYIHTAAAHAGNTFAQYTTAVDETQITFYSIQGGDPMQWTPGMQQKLTELTSAIPNFSIYVAGGASHCILPYDHFYTTETAGVKFHDWVAGQLAGEDTGDVICDIASGECLP